MILVYRDTTCDRKISSISVVRVLGHHLLAAVAEETVSGHMLS